MALEAHIVIDETDLEHMEAMKRAIKHTLGEVFHIHHTTLEFEFAPCHDPGCYEVNEAVASTA